MKFGDSLYAKYGIPFTETDIKFDVYRFYLECIRDYIVKKYSSYTDFAIFSWDNITFNKLSGFDEKLIKRFLYICWNTEHLSRLNDRKEIDLLKINNHWKPIQSYYAIYSAGEALAYLIDRSIKQSHRGCLDKLNRFLVEKIKIDPWSFGYKGYQREGFYSINFPAGANPISSLKRKDIKPIDIIATCLKAEHGNIIDEFKPTKNKYKKDYDPGYTTILDFLYRLRIKSNYKDVEIFITKAPDEYIKGFSNNLSFIVFYTLILFEILIMKRYGSEKFLKLATQYCKKLDNQTVSLNRRLKLYKAFTS